MVSDDAVNDRESEPGALADVFSRKEGLENPLPRFGIHATAGIGDPDVNEIAALATI